MSHPDPVRERQELIDVLEAEWERELQGENPERGGADVRNFSLPRLLAPDHDGRERTSAQQGSIGGKSSGPSGKPA
jgi:hypothetical protein